MNVFTKNPNLNKKNFFWGAGDRARVRENLFFFFSGGWGRCWGWGN